MNAQIDTVKILSAMHARGWHRAETAARCKIAVPTLNKILEGQMPHRLDTLYRLADGLGLSIQELFDAPAPKLRVVGGKDAGSS
jgi:transcriptional regulator with XRE-family HTH domain